MSLSGSLLRFEINVYEVIVIIFILLIISLLLFFKILKLSLETKYKAKSKLFIKKLKKSLTKKEKFPELNLIEPTPLYKRPLAFYTMISPLNICKRLFNYNINKNKLVMEEKSFRNRFFWIFLISSIRSVQFTLILTFPISMPIFVYILIPEFLSFLPIEFRFQIYTFIDLLQILINPLFFPFYLIKTFISIFSYLNPIHLTYMLVIISQTIFRSENHRISVFETLESKIPDATGSLSDLIIFSIDPPNKIFSQSIFILITFSIIFLYTLKSYQKYIFEINDDKKNNRILWNFLIPYIGLLKTKNGFSIYKITYTQNRQQNIHFLKKFFKKIHYLLIMMQIILIICTIINLSFLF